MRGGVKQTQRRLGRQRSGRTPIAVAMSSGLAGFLLGAGFWIYLGAREAAEREMPLSWDAPQSGCLGPSQSLRDTLTAWLGERLLR